MESLAQQYSGSVDFYILYVREAHPGQNYPAQRSFSEKLSNANDLKRAESVGRTILVDDYDGTMNRDYGARPNAVYVIGKDGVISYRADWNDPEDVDRHVKGLLAKHGMGAAMAPVDLRDNYVPVNSRLLRIANRVLWRAGFASVADSFLMTPNLIQGRLHAWMERRDNSGGGTARF
jgi:hypothetical protein